MKSKLPLILIAAGLSHFAFAEGENNPDKKTSRDKAKTSPYSKSNNSWITLSGKVTKADPNSFKLDYGKGSVLVEMDDWDWYQEGYNLLKNDQVTVTGRIDRDRGETTSIEASSVYVKGLQTFFYASAADEEDLPVFLALPRDGDAVVMQGTVTKIDGREFTLTNESASMVVDTKTLSYNPMDNKGYQQIRIGDAVRVYGEYDEGLLEKDEIHPTSLITLRKF